MKKPFLSVLIATYNRKDLLQRAIKSVQNQNFDDYELIISDDGSNDGTAEFCKDLCQKDKRVFTPKTRATKRVQMATKTTPLTMPKANL